MLIGFNGLIGQGGVAAQPTQTGEQPPSTGGEVTYQIVVKTGSTVGTVIAASGSIPQCTVTHTSLKSAISAWSQSLPNMIVLDGTYTQSAQYEFDVKAKVGTAATPLRMHFGNAVIIDGTDTKVRGFGLSQNCDYIEFKGVGSARPIIKRFTTCGFYLFGEYTGNAFGWADHITLDNLEIRDNRDPSGLHTGHLNLADGVLNAGRNNTIKNCLITNNSEHGIYPNGVNTGTIIQNNSIVDNTLEGIRAEGITMLIDGNTITGNGKNGVGIWTDTALAYQSDGITISNNTFTNNGASFADCGNIRVYTGGGSTQPKNVYIKGNTIDGTLSPRNILVVSASNSSTGAGTLGVITYDDALSAGARLTAGKVTSANFPATNTISHAGITTDILPAS